MRKLLLYCALLLLIAAKGYGQARKITGTVTDKTTGTAMVAVTVTNVEAKINLLTDINGHFSINAQNGQTLQFTSLGSKTFTVKVTDQTSVINVQLEASNTSLDEVVVTGYTSEKKKDLTGAVTVVNVNDVKRYTHR